MSDIQAKVVDEFMDLVKIDSLSLKEEKVFDYLKGRLKHLPVKIEFDEYVKEEIGAKSGNLIVKLPSNTKTEKKALFFDAHVDTVEPGIGIKPRIDGDFIRSDGTTVLGSDDKAGAAAMVIALEEIIESGIEHGDLYFLFTSAEEIGLMGVTELDFSKIKADYGYILDSHGSIGGVVIAAPYHYHYTITVTGKASHAGIDPDKGISAIKIASNIIGELPQGRLNDNSVTNIGMIEGGKAANIVPEQCVIHGEYRSLEKSDIPMIEDKIKTAVSHFEKEAVNAELEFHKMYDGFNYDSNEEIIKLTDEALKELGITPSHEKTGGGSNTNIYNQHGIKALTLACGMMNVHSTDEYVAIRDLVDMTRLVIKLAEIA